MNGMTPQVVVSDSTDSNILQLDVDREYTIAHDSETVTGTADTNTIYFARLDTDVNADQAASDDLLKLKDGRAVVIGPGWDKAYFETEAGAPTFTVVPGLPRFGEY